MAHELGHAIFKFLDYYYTDIKKFFSGYISHWGLMGNGTNLNPPAPIMSWNKIEAGWLTQKFVTEGTYLINLIEDLNYGDNVICYGTPSYAYYIFEGRKYPDGVTQSEIAYVSEEVNKKLPDVRGILMYRAAFPGFSTVKGLTTLIHVVPYGNTRYDIPTLIPTQEGFEPNWYYDDFIGARFAAVTKADGSMYLKIETIPLLERAGRMVIGIVNFAWEELTSVFSVAPILCYDFDIDLHAYTFDGKSVGMNYTSGEYQIQIEGARASGNIPACGPEWISVPTSENVFFTIDPTPARSFLKRLNITAPKNVTVTWAVIYYDEDGARYESTFNTTINLERPSILSIPIVINIDPDTLNLRSSGKWVTAYLSLPEEFNASEIELSSVFLNGSIGVDSSVWAIDDYNNDGKLDLMVKFDRSAVISLILDNIQKETTDTIVTLTIVGRLKDMTPFWGSFKLRIIIHDKEAKVS